MSLLIDALKKAEQIKKAPPIWQEKNTLLPPNSHSPSSLTTTADLSHKTPDTLQTYDDKSNHHKNAYHDVERNEPNQNIPNQLDEQNELSNELSSVSSMDEDFLITENLSEQTTFSANEPDFEPWTVDDYKATIAWQASFNEDDFPLEEIQTGHEEKLETTTADWENEFLPEFQAELADLENNDVNQNIAINQVPVQMEQTQLHETKGDNSDDDFLPEFKEHLEEFEQHESTPKTAVNQQTVQTDAQSALDSVTNEIADIKNLLSVSTSSNKTDDTQNNLAPPEKVKTLNPSTTIPNFDLVPIEGASHKIKSLPTDDKKSTPTAETEQLTQRELKELEKESETENKHQTAQRILAASTQPLASKRPLVLLGVLGFILISMGAGYYYYMQPLSPQSPKLQLGKLNNDLKNHEFSNNTQAAEIEANTPVANNQTVAQDSMAQTNTTSPHLSSLKISQTVSANSLNPQPEKTGILKQSVTQSTPVAKAPKPQPLTPLVKEPKQSIYENKQSKQPVESTDSTNQAAATNMLASTQNFMSQITQTMKIAQTVQDNKTEKAEKAEKKAETEAEKPVKKNDFKEQSMNSANSPSSDDVTRKANRQHSAENKDKKTKKSTTKANNTLVTLPVLSQQKMTALPQNSSIHTLQTKKVTPAHRELTNGYQAWQRGDMSTAQQAYLAALQQEPNNRDALLGLAAIAAYQGKRQQAQHYYRQILKLYPQDTLAQVGLINSSNSLSLDNESRLKLLQEKSPQSAHIHFSLGNLYARQGRWAQAQQAYFQAYHYDKQQADYAYNLAISLDQLNQPAAALTYYQRALQLTHLNPVVHFEPQIVQKRIQTLSARKM
jgi:Tfp pilus assembly protein PilF